jgi:hypothetical protein
MSVSIAAILDELRQIEKHSQEDVAVLMTPLLRDLEAVRDGRAPQLDHDQMMAIANSLAQTAAQAGDVDAAVAIATLSSDLEQLPPAAFSRLPTDEATAAEAPELGTAQHAQGFAYPFQQILGIVGICALSYAGYLVIQARFMPGSVAGWLLTGSSTLLALGLALGWRRYVLRRRRGKALTVLTLTFAVVAGSAAVRTGVTLGPRIAAPRDDATSAAVGAGTEAAAGPQAGQGSTDTAASPRSVQMPPHANADADEPIVFWWLGDTPQQPATRMRTPRGDASTAPALAEPGAAGTPASAQSGRTNGTASAVLTAPNLVQNPAATTHVRADTASQALAPDTPMPRYHSLLERDVVITDVAGIRHEGKLISIGKEGVTLLMELQMFGEPILGNRFYLFNSIERLRAK